MSQQKQPIEVLTPVGRLVGGHPMKRRDVKDDKTKQVLKHEDGSNITDVYIGFAIPKGTEQSWSQTEWGAKIYQAGLTGFPRGEYNAPTFAWKITDGDSAIPNKKGKVPNQREGYPGHWVLQCSTRFFVKCYHVGKYDAHQQIQNDNEIKPGDYCRLLLNVVDNGPSESPGVYLNPMLFDLVRAGVEIHLEGGPDANEAFGNAPVPELPPGAQVDTSVAPPAATGAVPPPAAGAVPPPANTAPPAPPAPAPAPPAAPVKTMTEKAGGAPYQAFIDQGWTDQMLKDQGYMIEVAPGTAPNTGFVNGQ